MKSRHWPARKLKIDMRHHKVHNGDMMHESERPLQHKLASTSAGSRGLSTHTVRAAMEPFRFVAVHSRISLFGDNMEVHRSRRPMDVGVAPQWSLGHGKTVCVEGAVLCYYVFMSANSLAS